jgi:energy-coupling factor transporter ATP-binding protein EcfA2
VTESLDAAVGQHDPADAGDSTDPGRPGAPSLPARLNALARLVQIGSAHGGPGGFDPGLLEEAADLLGRAGERMRLSGAHTVVTLAGGTGSGKSSLFNALAGANFSPVGVIRPTTGEPHACVWGMAGAGPLLDWIGIQLRHRYARSSALTQDEQDLTGLLLLDLPDHDSVTAGASHEVDRLVGLADLMIWVVDPQKYADAAVHNRYLVRFAAHSAVTTVVLNQSDLLGPEQSGECAADLRRLLDSEGLHDARVLATSAVTGAGLSELRQVLVEAVAAGRSAGQRIEADVDTLAGRFEAYAADGEAVVPESAAAALADAFGRAAGIAAAGDALQHARESRARQYVGWPVASLAGKLSGRDRLARTTLGSMAGRLPSPAAGSVDAQPAEIDNALTVFGSEAGQRLPLPWSRTVYSAARSGADAIPGALGSAIAAAQPRGDGVPAWWRLVRAWQWLLITAAVACLGWLGATAASDQPGLLPWLAAAIVALLLLGWLTSSGCMNMALLAAERERARVEQDMRARVAGVARELVLVPVRQELSEYDRFRGALKTARGHA